MLSFLPSARVVPRLKHVCQPQHRLCATSSASHPQNLRPPSLTRCRDVIKKKVALLLAYDGGDYHGLQRNAGVVTVSDVLERSLHEAGAISDDNLGNLEKIKWQVAARTDRGVCAAGNLVSAKLLFRKDELCSGDVFQLMTDRINSVLPHHVRVFGISQVTGSFAARTACGERWYEYMLPTSAVVPQGPISQFKRILNQFEGCHLFHNYTVGVDHCVPPRAQASRFITMATCDAEPIVLKGGRDENGGEAEWIRIQVRGQSFMLHQIRKMVSMAIMVHHKRVPENAIEMSFRKDVLANIPPAPAVGLFLDSCLFKWYNERHKAALERPVSFAPYEELREEFKQNHIFPSIARRAVEEDSLGIFFRTLDNHPTELG